LEADQSTKEEEGKTKNLERSLGQFCVLEALTSTTQKRIFSTELS
jgi:hypothetical protein